MPRCRRATPPSSVSCSVCSAARMHCRLIKRCNDFGAGGVSVAIGELADGLNIDLNTVTKKYEGLDGTELAISESQERMAVAVAAEDAETFMQYAAEENLEATDRGHRYRGKAHARMSGTARPSSTSPASS